LLCIVVMRPFLTTLLWAVIIAYASWPAYRRVVSTCRNRPALAAFIMTLLVALIVIGPLLLLTVLLQYEVAQAVQAAGAFRADNVTLPAIVRSVPWIADPIQQALERLAADPGVIRRFIADWATSSRSELLGVMGSVGKNLLKLVLTILTVYFVFRDGATLAHQVRTVLSRPFDDRLDRYVRAAGAMVRAVVFGFLITALAQGAIAGIGYAVVGVPAPIALGALTAFASVIPVIGTGLVWGVVVLTLLCAGHVGPGLALLVWCTLLVHPVDNILRPLLISSATQVPFLLVMFGAIGGIAAFGLVGLFIGPVALAIATAVWREWLEVRQEGPGPPDAGTSSPPTA
jgi:predicted PurR-regulated permease PerM